MRPLSVPAARPWTVASAKTRYVSQCSPRQAFAPIRLRSGEGEVDEHHELGGENPERRRQRPVGGGARDEERAEADVDRVVEHERGAVEAERAEPEQREEAVDVDDRRRLDRPPERAGLEDEAGEDRGRQERIGDEPARAREQPERRVALQPALLRAACVRRG